MVKETSGNIITRNRDDLLFKIGIALCVFAFILPLIRSAVTAITYDEAYTYLRIARENLFDRRVIYDFYGGESCIGNNHWLNSYLIHLVCRLPGVEYSEFMIRFPVLMFYAVYLFFVCWGFRKKLYSFPVLILLIGNYYLNEFYGLARGYSMANTLVFLFCLSYIYWKRSGYRKMRYLNLAIVFAALATFSNTIGLLLFPAVGCVCLYKLIAEKQMLNFLRRCWLFFGGLVVFSVVMLIYHLNIAEVGLFNGGHNFFKAFVMGYVRMLLPFENLLRTASIITSVILCLAVLRINLGMKDLDFGLMMILFIITILVMEKITHRGYVGARVLLPFYAFMVLAVSEIIGEVLRLPLIPGMPPIPSAVRNAAAVCLCAACLVVFAKQIDLERTKDWSDDYKYRTLETGSYMSGIAYWGGWGHPSSDFYIDKCEAIIKEYMSYLPDDWDPSTATSVRRP